MRDEQHALVEAALTDSEDRYRRLFEQATEGIALADARTGELLDRNNEFLQLTGYGRTELIGRHQSILHPKEALTSDVSRTFAQHRGKKRGETLREKLVTKSGVVKEVEIKADTVEIGGRNVVLGFFRDVTTEMRYHHERETTLKLLRLLNDNSNTHELVRNLTEFLL